MSLLGVPVRTLPFVTEGTVLRFPDGGLAFHGRVSVRARKRRPHGRTNGPRKWKVRYVKYQPELDALIAEYRER